MNVEWQFSPFGELSVHDVYEMLALRQQVFVIEQQCIYNDFDGYDQDAHHLLGWVEVDGKRVLGATLRVLAPGKKYAEASIGRVVSAPVVRGSGIGRELFGRGVAHAQQLYPDHDIRIGAQAYLEQFYASFGFRSIAPFIEDDIPHIEMLRARGPSPLTGQV
ncbi:GNAT family N-acetyltransferase [Pseudoduganella sp. GCM10020061]|uniref:GNAT family N-acetyltransferase n=1 Tax=Pseudoduganella sp. GCM10020061 TaxID=3317345 RepID=UPI0036429A0C